VGDLGRGRWGDFVIVTARKDLLYAVEILHCIQDDKVQILFGANVIMGVMNNSIVVVGGGLAGVEAAWQVARRGIAVELIEMRPIATTPAHRSDMLGELVCSSSLKSQSPETAHGLLKLEMRALGSLVLECADRAAVPGGDALCVDRDAFAKEVTHAIESEPLIHITRAEITSIPDDRPVIIATGPLTSPALCKSIQERLGLEYLHFYDAIAPSVLADSIDYDIVFRQSRYDKGEAAYLNCPMNAEQYHSFVEALVAAERAIPHLDEEQQASYYEGCLPVEIMASRGAETLSYGMMKPVGLTDPKTGRWSYAIVQLRQENTEGTIYGLVGFQTQLKHAEQRRVFRMIPGLENAEFARLGAVHRNTFINSPGILLPTQAVKSDQRLFFAGQITGVEGYMESSASGILAGINAARTLLNQEPVIPPRTTMTGSLMNHISEAPAKTYQPMNSNFGILPPIEAPHKKKDRKAMQLKKAAQGLVELVEKVAF